MHSSAGPLARGGRDPERVAGVRDEQPNERGRLRLDLGRVVVTQRREQRLPIGIGRKNRIRRDRQGAVLRELPGATCSTRATAPEPQSSDGASKSGEGQLEGGAGDQSGGDGSR